MMDYEIKYYPDGSHYAVVYPSNTEIGKQLDCNLTFRINTYADIWKLKQILDAHYSQGGQLVNLFIPWLIDGQADRRFAENESAGLYLVCDELKSLKYKSLKIFHPHNPDVVKAIIRDCEIIENTLYIEHVLAGLKKHYPSRAIDTYWKTPSGNHIDERIVRNTILMSADAGGFKPLVSLVNKMAWPLKEGEGEIYAASKGHGADGKLIQILDRQDFGGKDVALIDDLAVYGGTFVGLAKKLRERNVGRLFLILSHVTMPDPNPLLFELFDEVYVTNSRLDFIGVPDRDKTGLNKPDNVFIEPAQSINASESGEAGWKTVK